MKIVKFVDVEVEVEVDVGISEFLGGLPNTIENRRDLLSALSMAFSIIKNVPDDVMSTMNEAQRKITVDAIQGQVDRIKALPFCDTKIKP